MLNHLTNHIKHLYRLGSAYGIAGRELYSGVIVTYPVRLTYFGYVVSYSDTGTAWKKKTHKDRLLYVGYLVLRKISNIQWRLMMLNGIN